MKKNILNMFVVAIVAITIVGCKKAKEANTSDAEAATVAKSTSEKFVANTAESTIMWTGFKPTGSHTGTIAIENGVFSTNDGKIHSGTFLIDMKSIVNTDIPADKEGNAKIVGHLKSADFFDVEKFPSAAFEITGLEDKDGKSMLSGNLSIKGVKNNITFPVTIATSENELKIESEAFTIDRSKWNVKYGSKSFFDDLGDKFINDDIELKISVKAKKS
jgi:polyisoprenoid-binding protein YceI